MAKKSSKAAKSATRVLNRLVSSVKSKNNKKKGKKKGNGGNMLKGLGSKLMMGSAIGSRMLNTGIQFSEAPSMKGTGKGLRVHATLPAFSVEVAAASSGAGCLKGPGSLATSYALDPNVSGRYINPALVFLGGCFTRYAIKKAIFHYRQAGGVTNERAPMAFGWCDDFNHPAFTTPTATKVLSLQHGFEFNAWEDWSMEVDVPADSLRYSIDVSGDTSAAAYRLQDTGGFIGIQLFTSGAATTYGVLHIEWIVDFYDFSPIYTGVTITARHPDENETKTIDCNLERCSRLNTGGACPLPLRRITEPPDQEPRLLSSSHPLSGWTQVSRPSDDQKDLNLRRGP